MKQQFLRKQLFSETIFFNSTTYTKYLFNAKLFIAKNKYKNKNGMADKVYNKM
jgi:hypothetical protein